MDSGRVEKRTNFERAEMRDLKENWCKLTCLPNADNGVCDEDEQDDERFDERRNLVFWLLEPCQHLQHIVIQAKLMPYLRQVFVTQKDALILKKSCANKLHLFQEILVKLLSQVSSNVQ